MSDLPPQPVPTVRRGRLRTWLRYGAIALVSLATALFFAQRHMGELLAHKLEERFSEGGVFISWKSADWALGSGVRLHGLALYRDAAKRDRLALFGSATAILGDNDRLSVGTANTHLLLGSGAGETKLEHVDIRLLIQPDKADLQVCRASLKSLRIEADGAFTQAAPAGDAKADAPEKRTPRSAGLFEKVNLAWLEPAREWLKIQPGKDAPVLRLKFQPLPDDGGMNLAVTLDGTTFQWRGRKWDFMHVAVRTSLGGKKSTIEFDDVRAGHAGRNVEVAGAFDPTASVIRISRLDSGIDLLALARALGPAVVETLSAVSATGPWRIHGEGEFPLDHPESWRWNGDVALDGDFQYASGGTKIVLQKPAFAIRVEEQVVSVSDLKAGLWGGTLDAMKAVVHLPSLKNPPRFEIHAALGGTRPALIFDSLGGGGKQVAAVPFDWTGIWQFNGTGEIPLDHSGWRWNGDAALDGEFLYATNGMKIALQKPAFGIRVEDQDVTLSNLKAGLWGGSLEAKKTLVHLPSAKKNLRIETQAIIDGGQFASILDSFNGEAKAPRAVPLSWKGAWRINGAGEIPKDHPEKWRWNGEAELGGEFVYATNGMRIALQKPAFGIRVLEQDVTISDFKAGLWDGSLVASKAVVHLPSAKKKLRFETQATLNGARLPPIIDSFNGLQKQPRSAPFSWTGAWRISGGGEVPMERPENWRWNGDAGLDGDIVYASGGTKIAMQKPAFALRWEQQDVTISDFNARLWDGSLAAPTTLLHLPSPKTKLRFETAASLRDARLQSVAASFGKSQKQPGAVQCDWKGGGEFELASLAGSGGFSIGDTGFAHLPLLGGMHVLFEKLTPRFRPDVASTMTVKHRMAGGTLHLDDLKLDSKQTHIEADGTIDFVRDDAQITAQGRLRGITGLATVVLASLLEFEGKGPVNDVHWKLKSIPGVGLIRNTVKKIAGKEKAAVKGTGGGVKGAHGSNGSQRPGR